MPTDSRASDGVLPLWASCFDIVRCREEDVGFPGSYRLVVRFIRWLSATCLAGAGSPGWSCRQVAP